MLKNWQALWKASNGSLAQSPEWLTFRESLDKRLIFVTVAESGCLEAGICFFEETLTLAGIRKKTLIAYGTPLFTSEQALNSLKKEIEMKAKKYFYIIIRTEETNQRLSEKWTTTLNHTIHIDLTKSEADLLKQCEKKSIRWGIGYAQRQGLTFQEALPSDVSPFFELYKQTAQRGNFHATTLNYLTPLRAKPYSRLFVVKQKGKLVAGGLVLINDSRKTALLDLTSASDEGLKLQAMPFLYWNMMLWAKEQGMQIFDLGGYDAQAKLGEKTYAINQYKERFGGKIVELPIYSPTRRYRQFRWLHTRFRTLRKLYTKESDTSSEN